MKRTLQTLLSLVVVAASLVSCAKETLKENSIPAGEKIQVAVSGSIGEFVPANGATKANAESVVRVTWAAADDKVYVYDGSAYLGSLDVTPNEDNHSHALLSGTINASAATPTNLSLVYVKGAAQNPAITGGKISVDISTQSATGVADVPFVLYAAIAYDAEKLTKSSEFVPFKFATSVMTVNCTNLPVDANKAKINITKAEIDGVSTACELTVDGTGVTAVSGTTPGTITRTAGFEQADSRGSFKLALAADPTTPAARNILVFQDSKVSGAAFTSTTLAEGNSYNTVYQMGEYISNGAGGYAPAVKVTGVTMGKSKTTIIVDDKETLVATVTPANATNKQITWSSSDTSVATVDENGEVTGVAVGSANIFATTADGNFDAVCLVTVKTLPAGALKGVFTVSDDDGATTKQIYFSKGNLYADASGATPVSYFEANQYDFRTYPDKGSCINGTYDKSSGTPSGHYGLFTWSSTVADAVGNSKNGNNLFTNDPDDAKKPNSNFTVNVDGKEQTGWRTLSKKEWQYLFNKDNTYGANNRSGKYKYGVTVCGVTNCVVIAPDGWDLSANSLQSEYSSTSTPMTWEQAETAGLVCLPAAGARDGSNVYDVGDCGRYWSSSADGTYASSVYFGSGDVTPGSRVSRSRGSSVRLVTESK